MKYLIVLRIGLRIFDSIKDRFEEVIYKASELPVLKELESEDIQCLHMGKKVMKGSILL